MSMNREVVPWWMERQQAIKTLTARMVAEEVVVADATTIVPYRTALRQHGQYMVSGGGPDFITGSAQAAAWEFQARVGWHAVFEAGKGGNHEKGYGSGDETHVPSESARTELVSSRWRTKPAGGLDVCCWGIVENLGCI